ncbi:MAG: glycosyltransferase [Ectothiorhodospiraceae bacterium]|nr:glycosyltransferase [Ectothiorhodospiraceae bacterium]
MNKKVDVSVIVPVSERFDDVAVLYKEYKEALQATDNSFEFVYVLDGEFPDVLADLISLQASGEQITIIKLAKWFGEATALTAGFEHSSGDMILTLPAYFQIESVDIPKLLTELQNNDMVVARRWPRIDSSVNQFQTRLFHWALGFTGCTFQDLGCAVRAFKRQVINEVTVYGDQHRFLPVLAERRGFQISEIDVRQSTQDSQRRVYSPGVYIRRLLDFITVFFLVKFTKKPLRFFGLIGSGTLAIGGIMLLVLIIERLFFGEALADRPALLLSSLLIVLGVQVFAIGLIGELIIFTHAKDLKEYTIAEIIN